MHTAPGLVCSDWPEGCLLSCFDPSTTQTVLRFASEGRAWQYRVLPFGLSLSARVFTKIAEGALAPLREVGIRILTVSSMARTREQLCDHRDLVLRHLSQWGLRVNWEKSKLSPAQRISFLGVELDSVSMSARLTEERAQSVLNCLSSFGGRTVVHWNSFRGSWGIWHPQPRSRRSDCFIWDHFSTGYTPESRGGHGAAVHFRWTSHRSVAAPSAPGQTLPFYGPGCP